ncbi:hypothetical protein C7N43_16210, partial [Sphingobacteriales bacterium UPWRP_1]
MTKCKLIRFFASFDLFYQKKAVFTSICLWVAGQNMFSSQYRSYLIPYLTNVTFPLNNLSVPSV